MNSPTSPALEALKIDRPPPGKERGSGRGRLALILVLLLAAGAFGLRAWLKRGGGRRVTTAVAVQAASSSAAGAVLNASGYVTARRQATVSSKATGKVMEVLIEEGTKVDAGQVLARLDTSNVEASLHLAEAQVLSARRAKGETQAQLERAELDLKRIQPLADQKIASPSDLDRAAADVKAFAARLALQEQEQAVADRQVAVWKQEMEDRIVRAPFAGMVISKNAQPGEMISPISAGGGFIRTGIGTVVDMTSLEIEVDVNETYINRVSPGQKVTAKLNAYPDWDIPSKVIAIIPAADRQKATVKVRIGFEHLDPRILPDMGVKVAFLGNEGPGATQGGVQIPREAVRQVDGKDVVWVVQANKLERRAIRLTGGQEGPATVTGLSAGERVVVNGPPDLAEGQAVRDEGATKP